MKKLKIYIDTSVISHLHADDMPDRMSKTHEFWKHLDQEEYEFYCRLSGYLAKGGWGFFNRDIVGKPDLSGVNAGWGNLGLSIMLRMTYFGN